MKEALVDVPVKINIWIRTECQRRQFDVIREARPSILFIQSDGGRNSKEWEAIKINRKMIDEGIDWDCKVYRLYEDKNNGLYTMSKKIGKLIWGTVDRCIFLEDDDIPSVSYFSFCKELLDKYENDLRIQGISGFNPLGTWNGPSADYFFSGETNSSGHARWKRSIEKVFDYDLCYGSDPYVLKLMKKHLGNYTYKRAVKCAKKRNIDGHVPSGEFYCGISRATQNALYIMPKKNMISNFGCEDNSVHSSAYQTLSREEQRLYFSSVYEVEFPIKHPQYVIRDVLFEKELRKAIGSGHPWIRYRRRVIKAFKMIYIQGISGLLNKLKKLYSNRHEK